MTINEARAVIAALEAALRLVSPDHITPVAKRQIRGAVLAVTRDLTGPGQEQPSEGREQPSAGRGAAGGAEASGSGVRAAERGRGLAEP